MDSGLSARGELWRDLDRGLGRAGSSRCQTKAVPTPCSRQVTSSRPGGHTELTQRKSVATEWIKIGTKPLPQIKGDDVRSTKEHIRGPGAQERREGKWQSPEKRKEKEQQGPPCRNEGAAGKWGHVAPQSTGKAREAVTNQGGAETPCRTLSSPRFLTLAHLGAPLFGMRLDSVSPEYTLGNAVLHPQLLTQSGLCPRG